MRPLPVPYGQRFGRLVVTGPAPRIDKNTRWECRCDCGNVIGCRPAHVKNGNIRSCGCLASDERRDRLTTHGRSRSPLYARWIGMLTRCYYPETNGYRHYGGRGIQVCDRWRKSFADFLADMGEPPGPGYTLDRKDVNGNYEPGNVRWATPKEQAGNTRQAQLKRTLQSAPNLGKGLKLTDLREKLKAIRDAGNPWARNLVQCMDEAVMFPEDGPEVTRAMCMNARMLERSLCPEPEITPLSPAELAAIFGLTGEHHATLQ